MGLTVVAIYECDMCHKHDLYVEGGDFYHDYNFHPHNIAGWHDCLSLLPWPYEGFPEGVHLVCPECAEKIGKEHGIQSD